MNERIKQLKEQAMEWVPNQVDPDTKIRLLNAEKFAELIVRECLELVSVNRDLAIEDGWNVDEAMSTAINDIKEHFGVKE